MRQLTFLESVVVKMHPAVFMGFRSGDFRRMIRGQRIDPVFQPKATLAALCGVMTSGLSIFEQRFEEALTVDEEIWRRPVFLLGLPRSGTTHLFELLASTSLFAYPTRIDCFNPHTFLTLRKMGVARLLGRRKLHSRVIDNVQVGWMQPEEDDLAIFALTGLRGCVWRVFPRDLSPERAGEFFADPDALAAREWKDALRKFTRKLSALHRQPLLLKSPSHTTKVAEILSVFPEARFVTIFREPVSHFQSYRAMFGSKATGWEDLQVRPPRKDREFLEVIERQLRHYFATRSLIPTGQLVEIRHEDLLARPRETLGTIFESWGRTIPRELVTHLADPGAGSYRKNRYPPVAAGLSQSLYAAYAPLYQGGYYQPDASGEA
jgi:hypothetical protein